jgi:hypothetical protein
VPRATGSTKPQCAEAFQRHLGGVARGDDGEIRPNGLNRTGVPLLPHERLGMDSKRSRRPPSNSTIASPIGSLIACVLMSVGRKLFRLWIFATAGYILLASGLMFGWVRGEFVRAAFEEYGDAHAETLVPVACSSARGQAGVDYTKQQTWDKYLYATQSDNCWYPISKFRHLFSEYNDLSDDALIEKLYQDSGTPLSEARPWMTSAEAAGIALVPPLVLLMMGSTLVWAFRRG